MHIQLTIFIIAIIPPLTGITILLWDEAHPPRIRSTLALGSTFLLMALALAMMGMGSAIIDGRQPFVPYLVITGIPAITVLRMLQLELEEAKR